MDVSIIIVNYNEKNMTKSCLNGILKVTPGLDYEIIVVDNCSNDGSQEMLTGFKIKDLRLKVVLNNQNLGFGAGCNLGIKEATGKYILILNPDIAVLEGSIERLFQFMEENKQVGAVGPKLLDPIRTVQLSCYRYPAWYIPILRRTFLGKVNWAKNKLNYYLMTDFNHQEKKEVDWLLGACLMLRKKTLDEIGVFDERFFLYFEDVDLCRRAKIKGWLVYYYPEAEMFHYYQRTSASYGILSLFSKITWTHIVSAIRYFWKWHS